MSNAIKARTLVFSGSFFISSIVIISSSVIMYWLGGGELTRIPQLETAIARGVGFSIVWNLCLVGAWAPVSQYIWGSK